MLRPYIDVPLPSNYCELFIFDIEITLMTIVGVSLHIKQV